jgi:hypothetical protein
MAAKAPDIAPSRDRGSNNRGNLVLEGARAVRRTLVGLVERQIDLGERKAGQFDIEAQVRQGLKLDRQDLLVPPGVLGELVVSEDIGSPFGLVQMREAKRRHALHIEELGGLNAAMAA